MSSSYFSNDTIAAISTSLAGDGGVGIIRLSGINALSCSQEIVSGLENPTPRYLHRIEILDNTFSENKNEKEIIDDGLGVYFPSGHSFTGEEVVEIQVHGGRFLLQRILNLLISTGKCRLAQPGEFTFRAVKNGKLSLSNAEALGQLISAKSMFEVRSARKKLSVSCVEGFERVHRKILELLAFTELSIDFIDQDVEVISEQKLVEALTSLTFDLDMLLTKSQAARRIASGLLVVIAGEPNAGKSTLFNALLAEERAIVSPLPGTTRDSITEEIQVGPYFVKLADTAGMRDTAEAIEKEGVRRAKGLVEDAEAVLLVLDASLRFSDIVNNPILKQCDLNKTILVLNKSDLISDKNKTELTEYFSKLGAPSVVWVSAQKQSGLLDLLRALRKLLDGRNADGLNGFLATEFQLQMTVRCKAELNLLLELISKTKMANPELISARLHSAARALSDLLGETTPDDVLTKIFSEFCIGK